MVFLPDSLTNCANVLSDAVGYSRPSTINIIRSASDIASWACSLTALLKISISSGI